MCTVHQIRTDLYLHVACKYYGKFNIMKKKLHPYEICPVFN